MSHLSSHVDRDLDLSNAGRGVWLVKVPKYIANKWEKAPGNIEVGKLKITKRSPGQKAQVSLTLSESVLCLKEPGEENIPRDHRLDVSAITHQTLGVFSHIMPSDSDSVVPETEKLSMEGKIVQKLECRPYADNCYMKLKLESIRKASLPVRQVQQLDRIVQNFKPVSDHKHNYGIGIVKVHYSITLKATAALVIFVKWNTHQNSETCISCIVKRMIEYEEKKKAEGKKARDDKESVLEMLFAAFEKHQYYNIKDLVKITRQPIVYLKEILKEVCNYNLKNPHKNMWELKPEYRHYKEPIPTPATGDE